MKHLAATALVVLLSQCAPQCAPNGTPLPLPPGAYVQPDGCINLDAVPRDGRLDYAANQWRWDGRLFATAAAEDACARQIFV